MPAKLNLTGQRFGRLVVLCRSTQRRGGYIVWECRCDCGETKFASTSDLRKGDTKSCGCLRKQRMTTHGLSLIPEYAVWCGMKSRCNNRNHVDFSWYGERGIRVCDRWSDFAAFYKDMGDRPTPEHTIERKDVNGNYEPSNCVWLPNSEQWKNKRPR